MTNTRPTGETVMVTTRWHWATLALMLLGQVGCHHLGPSTIVTDRVPYNNAITTSWQQQTLLNIVRVRYFDTPIFVDVAQIVSGYTKQNSAATGLRIVPPIFPLAPFDDQLGANLDLQASFSDRPTISYTPQTGPQFIRNLTSPIPPSAVLYMMQAGYPIDVALELAVESINGVKNFSTSGGETRADEPQFRWMMQVRRRAQVSGSIGMRIEMDKEKKESIVFFFQDKDIEPEHARELAELRKLLGLDPSRKDFHVVFGATARGPNELAILTRSIFRMLTVLSAFVEVPLSHLAEGRAPSLGQAESIEEPPFVVHCGATKPGDCFAVVHYRGHWFWVDDRDPRSKRVFAFLLVFLALADTAPKEGLPVVTIQAN